MIRETSPGKMNTLRMNPAASTMKALVFDHLWISVCCATSSGFLSLLYSFCSSVPSFAVSLTSVLASQQTTLRLATLPRYYQSVERLALSGLLRLFERTIFTIQGAHSGFKKLGVQWLIEHSTSHQHLWWLDSFMLRIPQLLKPAKR